MKTVQWDELDERFFASFEPDDLPEVREIIRAVKSGGDAAMTEYTKQFDNVEITEFRVSGDEIESAVKTVDEETVAALKFAAKNIRTFARRQKDCFSAFEIETAPGVFTGQRIVPVSSVGIYAPGGRFPLPSTVLMCAVPAKAAGCERVILCSPPTYNGTIHPVILAAAAIAGIDEVYRIGGAQSVAAMAYGTETVPAVDKIVGPGNKYVAAAKKEVFGTVGIDFIAGPTEVLIIADETADPAWVAADMLAQAEHDTDASAILITTSPEIAREVEKEVNLQLPLLGTKETVAESIEKNGIIILADTLFTAVKISNRLAPEHLELQVENPEFFVSQFKHYGSLFIGRNAVEALGDYTSGLNHTLPTNRCARYTGGLSVKDFLTIRTTLRVTGEGINTIGPVAVTIARSEGLAGHAASVLKRLDR